jgi:hypothetical protein
MHRQGIPITECTVFGGGNGRHRIDRPTTGPRVNTRTRDGQVNVNKTQHVSESNSDSPQAAVTENWAAASDTQSSHSNAPFRCTHMKGDSSESARASPFILSQRYSILGGGEC